MSDDKNTTHNEDTLKPLDDGENFQQLINIDFTSMIEMMVLLKKQINTVRKEVETTQKKINKRMKKHDKARVKHERRGNRRPSGFASPSKISPELCNFMKKPENTLVARTEVTRYIIAYIKENNLQWNENRKIIKPDKKLKKLLRVKTDEEVNFFNIQRFMNIHFEKKSPKNKKVGKSKMAE